MTPRASFAVVVLIAILSSFVLPSPAAALQTEGEQQQAHPNNEKGFAPDKIFQLGDVDSVNLFNGNVILRIPLGQAYSVGDHLAYQFGLTYNAKNWDYRNNTLSSNGQDFLEAVPSWRPNAGFGWLFSLGRLIAPGEDQIAHNLTYIYESPDGSDHPFASSVETWIDSEGINHDQEPVWRSASSLHLRMSLGADGTRRVEFPDGTTHVFSSSNDRWRLTKMLDRFGHEVTISYTEDSTSETWMITDRDRTHRVVFLKHPTQTYQNYRKTLSILEVGSFGGGTPARYDFDYTFSDVPQGCLATGTNTGSSLMILPTLTRIRRPDGSTWEFDYHFPTQVSEPCESCAGCEAAATSCDGGLVSQVTYPTRGIAKFYYQTYQFSTGECGSRIDRSPGLLEKRVLDQNGEKLNSTVYTLALGPKHYVETCETGAPITGGPFPRRIREWISSSITTYERNTATCKPVQTVENFFSVWSPGAAGAGPYHDPVDPPGVEFTSAFDELEYGLAVMKTTPPEHESEVPLVVSMEGVPRYLSTKTYTYDDLANKTLARVGYAKFFNYGEGWQPGGYAHVSSRVDGTHTVDYSDPVRPYADTTYTDFDGYGHFRKSTTTSSLSRTPGAKRVSYTGYNLGAFNTGSYPNVITIGMARPWILDTVTRQSLEDEVWHNGAYQRLATHQTFGLESATGLVTSQRTHVLATGSVGSVPAPATGDLLTNIAYDTEGRVSSVTKSGGDGTASTGQYTTTVNWLSFSGSYLRISGRPVEGGVVIVSDEIIDRTTGLVASSSDAAGVQTTYTYDAMGRLTGTSSPGSASASYSYGYIGGLPRVDVTMRTSGTGSLLGSESYRYDSLGRIVEKTWLMPDGSYPSDYFTYNGMGWLTAESRASAVTLFQDFDSYGRVRKIVQPDGSLTTFVYVGDRRVETTTAMTASTVARKREDFDHLGRLVAVTEVAETSPNVSIDTTGIKTTYGYGLNGKLSLVCQNAVGTGCGQERKFLYDARGLLKEEIQPESGSRLYEGYDAGGHAWVVREPSASVLDQQFTLDSAERLIRVEARNPYFMNEFRVLKEFTYATSNTPGSLSNGKLIDATRHNYIPFKGDVSVLEEYSYGDAAGRRTGRVTTITNESIGDTLQVLRQSFTFDDLGNVISETYPLCEWESCGSSPGKFDRVDRTYTLGRLTSATSVASAALPILTSVEYHATGLPTRIAHGNGINETITPDPWGMARPREIRFSSYGACEAPQIQQPPQATVVFFGGQATLSVTATAAGGELRYQWYDSSGPINGATNSFYVTPQLTESNTYFVNVRSWCGTRNSAGAEIGTGGAFSISAPILVLACSGPPAISTQPAGSTIPNGQSASLSVAASGTGPFVYSWYRGEVGDVSTPAGGNQSTLLTDPLSATTQFWVRVTNDCGPVDSTAATVTVLACAGPPAITTQPASQSIAAGGTAILSVVASGTGPFSYAWYRSAPGSTSNPVGTNASSFTTPPLSSSEQYWVRISNACGGVDSAGATISVLGFATPVRRQFASGIVSSNNYVGASWTQTQQGSLLLAFVATKLVVVVTPPPGWQEVAVVSGPRRMSVFAAENAASRVGWEQFNLSGYTQASIVFAEYTGVALSSALDKTATATGTSLTASSGTTAATSQTHELVVTFLGANSATFATATNGFSEVRELLSTVVHDKIVTATGTYGHTCTMNTSQAWRGIVLSFRAKPL